MEPIYWLGPFSIDWIALYGRVWCYMIIFCRFKTRRLLDVRQNGERERGSVN